MHLLRLHIRATESDIEVGPSHLRFNQPPEGFGPRLVGDALGCVSRGWSLSSQAQRVLLDACEPVFLCFLAATCRVAAGLGKQKPSKETRRKNENR